MDKVTIVGQILTTLNAVEVRGKANLDRLLGCIQALESLAEELKNEQSEVENNGE